MLYIKYINTDEEQSKLQMIENLKQLRKKIPVKEKSEMTKSCFWIPERTPETISDNSKKPLE